MHGVIHVILKDLVVSKFGAASWAKIVAELGAESDEELVQADRCYEDEVTFAAVGATAKVLGVTLEQALAVYGAHFVDVVHMADHLRMMRSMGDNISDFLDNVNHLHHCLHHRFRKADFPRFNVRHCDEDDTFVLSYASSRGAVLAPLVEGILTQAAARLHGQHLEMTRLEEPAAEYLVSWRVKATLLPLEKRPPEPVVGGEAKAVGGLWHSVLVCGCGGGKKGKPAPEAKMTTTQRVQLDNLEHQAEGMERTYSADLLMRSVRAEHVAAEWDDLPSLDRTSGFWRSKVGMPGDYQLSQSATGADRFVTHSWSPPIYWEEIMGKQCSYADIKAIELWIIAMDIAEEKYGDNSRWRDITFWVDKCCIPQKHSLTRKCISMIENFIQRSEGMTVLFTWDYFSRLWCVYEWAAFLVWHSPDKVQMCNEMFMRPATRPHFLHSIRTFSVRIAQCFNEGDRTVLKAKVAEYYYSEAAFERFAKCTVVAVLSRSAAYRAGGGAQEMDQELKPLRDLARELEEPGLAAALELADPIRWRRDCRKEYEDPEKGGAAERLIGWQKSYKEKIRAWFLDDVVPEIERVKSECVLGKWLDLAPMSPKAPNSSRPKSGMKMSL